MKLTLQDMRDALKGQARSEEAIFWFANAWHGGKDTDLYAVLQQVNFTPRRHAQKQINEDPEILYCFDVLGKLYVRAYGRDPIEFMLGPVPFDEVKEGDVLVHGKVGGDFKLRPAFPCIDPGWPCRVHCWHGDLGVACAEGPNGSSFHPLKRDEHGMVEGFVR